VWRVIVDHDQCLGSGLCTGSLPSRFRMVGGKSIPVDAEIEADEEVLDAADYCPLQAIRIVDLATGNHVATTD
jgi:ferredoxin